MCPDGTGSKFWFRNTCGTLKQISATNSNVTFSGTPCSSTNSSKYVKNCILEIPKYSQKRKWQINGFQFKEQSCLSLVASSRSCSQTECCDYCTHPLTSLQSSFCCWEWGFLQVSWQTCRDLPASSRGLHLNSRAVAIIMNSGGKMRESNLAAKWCH